MSTASARSDVARAADSVLDKAPVSVLILTRNEEANLAGCLESVRWAAEAFVVDSLSTDRTVEIAAALGGKIYPHPFEGYADQRNWALKSLPFAHEWILMLDADERVPAALADEIKRVLDDDGRGYAGYYLKPRHIFMGRWLKHGGLYPTWLLRLFKRTSARVEERPVNEHVILAGQAGYLTHPLDHFDQRPLSEWVAKHNRYADFEAEDYLRETSGQALESSISVSLRGSQAGRKRWIKRHVWNRLPVLLRPFLFFFRNYFLKGGFLDAREGFIYHILWSFWYPFLIGAKIRERQSLDQRTGVTPEPSQSGAGALSKVAKP